MIEERKPDAFGEGQEGSVVFGTFGGKKQTYRGPAWYQEPYFLAALKGAMAVAADEGQPLALVVVDVPGCSRRSAKAFVEFAGRLDRGAFIGLLSNGEFAICLPGSDARSADGVREELLRHLGVFEPVAGVGVFRAGQNPEDLIRDAAHEALAAEESSAA